MTEISTVYSIVVLVVWKQRSWQIKENGQDQVGEFGFVERKGRGDKLIEFVSFKWIL